MADIGQMVGFADYSAFYRAFKKEYGISPKQFMLQRFSMNANFADTSSSQAGGLPASEHLRD